MTVSLDLLSVVDDVFIEEDAFTTDATRRMTIGRIYESWKKWKDIVDPDYMAERDRRRL